MPSAIEVGDMAVPSIKKSWSKLIDTVGEPLRNFLNSQSMARSLSALRHALPTTEIEAIRQARRDYLEMGHLPSFIHERYPFIEEFRM